MSFPNKSLIKICSILILFISKEPLELSFVEDFEEYFSLGFLDIHIFSIVSIY